MKNRSEKTTCTHESKRRSSNRAAMLLAAILVLTIASSQMRADTGSCGGQSITLPFIDVPGSNIFFCSIAEAYILGLTNGTDSTHYSPSNPVTRDQMAAFITRTEDSALRRGSRRAALNQWAQPSFSTGGMTDVGSGPAQVVCDGADLWLTDLSDSTVSRVRASDGKLLETWTGATFAFGLVVSRGRIFITGHATPGTLYRIDPKQPAGAVATVTNQLGGQPEGITTDGPFIWTANSSPGSVSKVNPVTGAVTTFTTGFNSPFGILYDGSNIWVADFDNTLKKLDSSGNILQTISTGQSPRSPIFDGTNIWVLNLNSDSVTVVRVKDSQGNPLASAFVLATLTGNGLNGPYGAAFDGERILVTTYSGDSVSLWKATDLIPIDSFSLAAGSHPLGACSDGVNFWITLNGTGKLARF